MREDYFLILADQLKYFNFFHQRSQLHISLRAYRSYKGLISQIGPLQARIKKGYWIGPLQGLQGFIIGSYNGPIRWPLASNLRSASADDNIGPMWIAATASTLKGCKLFFKQAIASLECDQVEKLCVTQYWCTS